MTALEAALGFDQDAEDQRDVARHVLGNLILPRTVADFDAIFKRAKKDGATLPTGEAGRFHADVANVRKTLDNLVKLGLAKVVTGYDDFAKMIEDLDADPDVVDNNLDPQDAPHAEDRVELDSNGIEQTIKAYYQTATRGALWADKQASEDFDPTATHWVMTRLGFRALTGHDQGERAPVASEDAA